MLCCLGMKTNSLKYKFLFSSTLIALLSLTQTTLAWNEAKLGPQDLPDLALLEKSALEQAGLDPNSIRRWQKNSRLSALLPRLQAGFEQKADYQNTAIIQDSISVTSAGVTIGPEANRIDQDFGSDRGFEVKAVWAFDEVLFNRNELDVSREARDLLVARNRLSEDLRQSYFELKTLLTQLKLQPEFASDPLARLKTEQLVEKLNSLSAGEFKRQLEAKSSYQRFSEEEFLKDLKIVPPPTPLPHETRARGKKPASN